MKDLSPEEAGRWMTAAPQVVQDAVTSPATKQVLNGLSKKYSLHVDVSGLLEKLTSYVLLGYVRPEEFLQEMTKAGVSDKDAREIMTEINQKIFVPLRKEEEKGVAVEPRNTVPEPATHFNLPVPQPIPPAPKKDWSNLPPAPMKGTLPPKVFLPRSSTLADVVRSALAVPKPVDTGKLLEDHEEPHIELNKADVPMNLPGVMMEQIIPEIPIPEVRPSPEFPKVEPQIQKPVSVTPITSYSSDPYREPIDEPIDEM